MRFIRNITAALLLLGNASAAFAGGYQPLVDRFFEIYAGEGAVSALDYIYSSNPWISATSDAVQNVKNQLVGIQQLVGDYHGYERIGDYEVAGRFSHVTYMALYDRQPVRFEFQFYRAGEEWMTYSFAFDVDLDDEIEAAQRSRIAAGR